MGAERRERGMLSLVPHDCAGVGGAVSVYIELLLCISSVYIFCCHVRAVFLFDSPLCYEEDILRLSDCEQLFGKMHGCTESADPAFLLVMGIELCFFKIIWQPVCWLSP